MPASAHSARKVSSTWRARRRSKVCAPAWLGRAARKPSISACLPALNCCRSWATVATSGGDGCGGGDEGRRRRAAGRQRHDLVAAVGDEDGVLPLGRQGTVLGDDGPAIAQLADLAPAGVDHGLDREHHAGHQFIQRAGAAVVQHLGLLVEDAADAVAAELAHDREAGVLSKRLYGMADIAQPRAGANLGNALPHGLVSEGAEPLGGNGPLSDDEHAAGVTVPAVLDDGDVDVDDVAVLQRLVVRDAVADLLVDRCADRLGVGDVARRAIVQWRGDRLLDVDDVVVGELVELIGRDTRLDMRREHVEHFGCQAPGDAHAGDVGSGLDRDGHVRIIDCTWWPGSVRGLGRAPDVIQQAQPDEPAERANDRPVQRHPASGAVVGAVDAGRGGQVVVAGRVALPLETQHQLGDAGRVGRRERL
mmetsp:Transcript_20980/g.80928  ORF Transcript_20980/g.80928 Transcript_20980/m.80928 type:complete len:420 (+) Transcript_20980:106-1365(+)